MNKNNNTLVKNLNGDIDHILNRNAIYGVSGDSHLDIDLHNDIFNHRNFKAFKIIESSPDPVLAIINIFTESYFPAITFSKEGLSKTIARKYNHLINVIITQGALHLKYYPNRSMKQIFLAKNLFNLMTWSIRLNNTLNSIQRKYIDIIIETMEQLYDV